MVTLGCEFFYPFVIEILLFYLYLMPSDLFVTTIISRLEYNNPLYSNRKHNLIFDQFKITKYHN
jgi:hypothetical protein